MGVTVSGTSELRSRISSVLVDGTYEMSTYTYLKYCPTYVIGYGGNGVQILKGQRVYGGIRDVRAAVKSLQEGYNDLRKTIRGWGQSHKDLVVGLRPGDTGVYDLSVYLKQTTQSYKDLYSYLKGRGSSTDDLPVGIKIWIREVEKNLPAYIKQTYSDSIDLSVYLKQCYGDYFDINSILRSWKSTYGDIPSTIRSWFREVFRDISSYLMAFHKSDINSIITPIPGVDLGVFIQHDDKVVNLFGYLRCKYSFDISGVIHCFWTEDLTSYLFPVEPFYLGGAIVPVIWQDLQVYITGWLGPISNLTSYISTIPANNLGAVLYGWGGLGVIQNLKCFIQAYDTKDITSSIYSVPSFNLGGSIIVDGQSFNLGAILVPSVVYFKSVIKVALLEHIDLGAYINYRCFYTDWRSLGASMYSWQVKNLKSFIAGWNRDVGTTYKNLGSKINTEIIQTQDKIILKFLAPQPTPYAFTVVKFGSYGNAALAFNTLLIKYWGYFDKDLGASITGILHSRNLGVYINAVFDWNYSELPHWIRPRTREVVIDLRKFKDNVKTFVELMFSSTNASDNDHFHYFYVSGEQRAYRVDRNKHWTLRADGYIFTDGDVLDRITLRKKLIFKLSDYNTIDEAVRDIINRAGSFSEANLGSIISGVMPPYMDLGCTIGVKRPLASWMKSIKSIIHSFDTKGLAVGCMVSYEGDIDLSLYAHCNYRDYFNISSLLKSFAESYSNLKCTVRWYKGDNDVVSYIKIPLTDAINLGAVIVGRDYIHPLGNHVEFDFVDGGYSSTTASGMEFDFNMDNYTERYDYTLPDKESVKVRVSRINVEILRKVD